MTRDRDAIIKLLKSWAGDHSDEYAIIDPTTGEVGVIATGQYLSDLIRTTDIDLDLLDLLDRLDIYLELRKKPKNPDGLHCVKCGDFYMFAESNQPDGALICYSCRQHH